MKITVLTKTENRVKLPLEFGIIIFLFSPRRGHGNSFSRAFDSSSMNYRLKQGTPVSIPYANENRSSFDIVLSFLASRVASLLVSTKQFGTRLVRRVDKLCFSGTFANAAVASERNNLASRK